MAFLGGGRRGVARYADGDMAPPAPGGLPHAVPAAKPSAHTCSIFAPRPIY